MFFLLRATFWLSLIFLCVYWGGTPSGLKHVLDGLTNTNSRAAKSFNEAKAQLESACLERPKTCMDIAARLNQIVTEQAQAPKAKPENAHPSRTNASAQSR